MVRLTSRRIVLKPLQDRAHPGRIGLSGAGSGMDQPAFARQVGTPDLLLKGKRRPPFAGEPLAYAVGRVPVAANDGGCWLGERMSDRGGVRRLLGSPPGAARPAEVERARAAPQGRGLLFG